MAQLVKYPPAMQETWVPSLGWAVRDDGWEECGNLALKELLAEICFLFKDSLVAQLVKNPPAMWETWVQFLGWEDPLEKGIQP